jgi:hypothetical protein
MSIVKKMMRRWQQYTAMRSSCSLAGIRFSAFAEEA